MSDSGSSTVCVQEQPALFPLDEVDLRTLDKPEVSARYTAVSLERHRAKRDAIIGALAEGHGLLRIAKAFRVSHHLVAALRDSRPDLIAIEKAHLSRHISRVLHVCIERFEDAVMSGSVAAAQLPIAFGIFCDKKAALDGDPNVRVDVTHRHAVTLELVAGYLAKRGIAMPAIDVESTVSSPDTQDRSESDSNGCTTGRTPAAPAAPGPDQVEGVGGGGEVERGGG